MRDGHRLAARRAVRQAILPLVLASVGAHAAADVVPGHRLPEGQEHVVREREIDILRLRADLRIDLDKEMVSGAVDVSFASLRDGLAAFSLDAAGLDVTGVRFLSDPVPLTFSTGDRALTIRLPRPWKGGEKGEVRIAYSARPKCGLYFHPASSGGAAQAWNYGEGGRHYGFLPLYNDTNDRFAVEWLLTVARPFVALANGALAETRENTDGSRTFRWVQDEPIPNYLLALDVGEFVRVALGEVRLGARTVPLAAWASPGKESAVAFEFRNTPKMLEFFSERFGHPYPWAKYDEVPLREFEGAMETTTMVGFAESDQRLPGDPEDSSPEFDEAFPTWTYEDTIAHELAHHWFGDLLTCRSLASLFLNESFASFAHTVWNEHVNGPDDFAYQRWRYLNAYLDYVRKTGQVRPLQYARYEAPAEMYQEETTYVKGALVLNTLRHLLGDDAFFRGIAEYLRSHEFSEVEAVDLQSALENASGRNLAAFFRDWIVGGGGHPSFDVSYRYSPGRRAIDLTVRQVQADQPFENAFHLPVDVEVVTAAGAKVHKVELAGWTTQVSLPVDGEPAYVAFDKGGWLVAEVAFSRPLSELRAQLERGGVAERLRAARQLAEQYPRRADALGALARVLADPRAHWGLRQEAARDLGAMGGPLATSALLGSLPDPDRRVRRAVALAIGEAGGTLGVDALRKTVETDAAEDVVAVAERSLGRLRAPGTTEFLKRQLSRSSRWWNAVRLGALLGLVELQDPALVPLFREYVDARWERPLRRAALEGWFGAAPHDPALPARLRELTADRNSRMREAALEKLGALHRAEDAKFLRDFAGGEPDPDLAQAARAAAAEIEAFVSKTEKTAE